MLYGLYILYIKMHATKKIKKNKKNRLFHANCNYTNKKFTKYIWLNIWEA